MKTKIYLVGPFLTRSGYGEQARFAIRALRSRENQFDIYLQPLSWGATSWIPFQDEEKEWIDNTIEKTIAYLQQGGQFDATIQVTIPNEWKKLTQNDIGYTAGIESNKVSHEWISHVNELDKVIVVSNHAKNVFETTSYIGQDTQTGQKIELQTTTEISAVNYPAKIYNNLPEIDLELPTKFNFLSIAQMGPRKNIENQLRWFIEEFHDEEVGFVIKTNQAKNCLMDRETCEGTLRRLIAQYPDRKCRVYLLHGDMTDEEIHALYINKQISAFVAIPHGEGFGLPIFEATYMGLPVVATGWSGQMDFLVDEKGNDRFYNVAYDINLIQQEAVWDNILIKESAWAYARETSYKNKLRQCYDDINNNTGIAADACAYAEEVRDRFEESKMYEQFVSSLDLELDTDWSQELSKIEIL